MPAMEAHEPSSAKDGRGDADEVDGDEGQHVGERDEDDGGDHCPRIGALRLFDFFGDGGGVVPAHVIPHGDEDAAEKAEACASGGSGCVSFGECAELGWRENDDECERRGEEKEKPERSDADDANAGEI